MNENHKTSNNQAFTPVEGLSTRPSIRSDFSGEETPEASGILPAKGADSIPISGIPSAARPAHKPMRLTRAQLEKLEDRLSALDHAVLQAIRKYRFLTSDQIGRLYVPTGVSKSSKTRVQNLMLKRLSDHNLIRTLERRVGGYGGGSTQPVWHLTEGGHRLLTLNDPDTYPRKRFSR